MEAQAYTHLVLASEPSKSASSTSRKNLFQEVAAIWKMALEPYPAVTLETVERQKIGNS